MALNLQDLRRDYAAHTLDITDVQTNPFNQFEIWMTEALDSQVLEANAMVLSTLTKDKRPTARVVLLKGFDAEGLVFFTNYNSRKSQEMEQNPYACLVFNWLELQRQVRIEGTVERISAEASTAYFQSRPKGSQIGAWVSPQSQVISGRSILEEKVKEVEAKYQDVEPLPRPEHWGGFVVKPTLIEFWQGRMSRLHDRIQYSKVGDGDWKIERLAP
ncbi:MAG: pyridoxamine 5'-phosphate oxidase [Saprospiraceae bacterium]